MYQPQVETWTNFARLEGRAALAYARSEDETPEVGSARLSARTNTDLESRRVLVHSLVFEDVQFPSLTQPQAQGFAAELKRRADGKEMVVELERLVADVEQAEIQSRRVSVSTDPPEIFVSQEPAILVQFDGEPVESPIQDSDLTFVINTNWDVLKDPASGGWYLLNDDVWLQAAELAGPWTPSTAPDSFSTLPADDNWATVRSNIPGREVDAASVPKGVCHPDSRRAGLDRRGARVVDDPRHEPSVGY
jgi:hypothetical protein